MTARHQSATSEPDRRALGALWAEAADFLGATDRPEARAGAPKTDRLY